MSRNEKGQMKLFSLCSGSLTKGGLFTSGPMHLPMVIALKRPDGGGRFFPVKGRGCHTLVVTQLLLRARTLSRLLLVSCKCLVIVVYSWGSS